MKTPTQMKRSSASDSGITPSATLSATALATACCAGPNICTAWLAPLIVTLLNSTVEGLQARFGATSASSEVKPSLLFVKAFANAVSAALPRGPISRSMWATSLPSPTRDSPTQSFVIFAICQHSSRGKATPPRRHTAVDRQNGYPCCQHPAQNAGPVSRIAAEARPADAKSTIVAGGRQDVP